MQGFLAPAIGLMNRLTYPGKFAVTGLLAFVSVSILVVALAANLYESIRLARNELAVTELIRPLQKQIQLTQEHRGISAAFLSGDASMKQKLELKQAEVNAAVKTTDEIEARHSTLLGSRAEWRAIKADWDLLCAGVMGMRTADTLATHGRLIVRLLRFQEAVADAGGINLDSGIDVYYLGTTLVKTLPEMLERLGKTRAKGTGILVAKKLTSADRIEFLVYRELLKDGLESLKLNLEKVGRHSPELAPTLQQFALELGEASELASGLLDTDILSERFGLAPQDFFDKYTQAIDIGYREMFATLLPTLDRQLEERISRLQTWLVLEIGLVVVFLFLLTYVSFGAYYSIMESVRRLSVGASNIAAGDLTARISLEGRDELTSVGDSFNVMAGALDDLLRKSELASNELAEALAEARLADQTKDAFLANMSHELRTPLSAVIGMAGLARNLSTDPKQQDYLDKITRSGKHLNRIINELLDLSKIAAGRMEFETLSFSLRKAIEHSCSVMAHRAEEKGLELVAMVDPAVPDVLLGDPTRIEQIVLNLLGNAIKFTAAGRIEMRVHLHAREAHRICIDMEIEDTGIGMRPEDVELLFKPFTQVDATMSRRYGGTGLGLAISRRLAEMMDGDISVSSREGQGTIFRVRIWLTLGDATELPADEATADETLPTHYQDTRVLVVDDQALNREIVEALLAAVGVAPRMAENGKEALDILTESGPDAFDLVLMDVQMPVMDGLTATRSLRDDKRFEALPIVAMTAHTLAHEQELNAAAGMVDHIGKPFDNAGFYRTLARWIPKGKQRMATASPSLPPTTPMREPEQAKGTVEEPTGGTTKNTELRTLRDVDVAAGLARLGGNEARYRHWLAEFVATAGTIPDSIRSDVAAGRQDAAAKTAHAFKGRVGMLGMTALHAIVTALEPALRNSTAADDDISTLERSIAEMRDQLARVLDKEATT